MDYLFFYCECKGKALSVRPLHSIPSVIGLAAAFCCSLALLPTTLIAQTADSFETPEYLAQRGLGPINASTAYAAGFTGTGSLIAVIDDGFQLSHPEFQGKVVDQRHTGWLVDGFNVPVGTHGTHVAGLVAARRDGTGMHGVAFDANLAFYTNGFGRNAGVPDVTAGVTDFDIQGIIEAFNQASAQNATVISNSWGVDGSIDPILPGGADSVDPILALGWGLNGGPTLGRDPIDADRQIAMDFIQAMDNAQQTSVIVFAVSNTTSLNNADITAGMPLVAPRLQDAWLAVVNYNGGSTVTAPRPGWPVGTFDSYRGGELISGPCGDAAMFCLAAHGVDVLSTFPQPLSSYTQLTGTSMATPQVAGAIAIARQIFPEATPAQLSQLVLQTATDIGAPGVDRQFGWGLLNLANLTQLTSPASVEGALLTQFSQFSTMGAFMDVMNSQTGSFGTSPDRLQPLSFSTRTTHDTEAHSWFPESVQRRVWLSPMLEYARIDSGATWTGFETRAGGLALGYDLSDDVGTTQWRLGAAVGLSQSSVKGANNVNSGQADGLHIGLYGGINHGNWVFDGSLQLGYLRQDKTRINVGGLGALNQTARASFNNFAFEANVRMGYTFTLSDTRVTPFLVAETRRLEWRGYTETGADVFNMTVAGDAILQTEIGPGLRVESPLGLIGGLDISSALYTSAKYVLDDHTPASNASLFGRNITNTGIDLGRHLTSLGAEISFSGLDGLVDATLRYDGRFRKNAVSHSLSAMLTMTF